MKTIAMIILTLLTMFATLKPAWSAENLKPDLFENCPNLESVSNINLDEILKNTDTKLKVMILDIAKNSKLIDKQSGVLADSFTKLHDFIADQQDLIKAKAKIQAKKEEVVKKNAALLADLNGIKTTFDTAQTQLGEAYCSVVSLVDYFNLRASTAEDEQLLVALGTSSEQLEDKKRKLDAVLEDFDQFWGDLNGYIGSIETSAEYLEEFMNSVLAFENATCRNLKKEGQPCPFKSEDINALLTKQKHLLDTNMTFLEAKRRLIDKSAGWGKVNE